MHFLKPAQNPLLHATVIACLLTACGGGSGGSDPTATASAAPTDATAQSRTLMTVTPTTSGVTSAATSTSSSTTAADIPPSGPGVFIDAVNGNDANPGTQAQPWRTLSKLVGIKLSSGNGVNLHCGSVWRESISLNNANLAPGAVIGGYGPCSTSPATISGADLFNGGWTKNGNVWSRPLPAGTPKITRLYVNGVLQRIAQWPNYGGIGHEYAYVNSASGGANSQVMVSASDLAALSGKDLTGATVNIRVVPWFISTRTVTSYNSSSGVLALNNITDYIMSPGSGYVLQDKLWMLDAPGEFYHDQANQILYVYPSDTAAQNNMNAATAEGIVRSVGVGIGFQSSLVVRYLSAVKNNTAGIALYDAPNAFIEYTDASDNVGNGIVVQSSTGRTPGITIRSSTFNRNSVSGIQASATTGAKIVANSIQDNAMVGTASMPGAALDAGSAAYVYQNTVQNAALGGILHSGDNGTQVLNNFVNNACARLTDCGGIDTWNGNGQWTAQTSLVANNVVAHQHPNTDGAVGGNFDISVGIYNDEFTKSITVRNNYVVDVPVGLQINDGSNQVIDSNKFWMTTRVAMWVNNNSSTVENLKNNTFTKNQIVPISVATGTYPSIPQIVPSQAVWIWDTVGGVNAILSGNNTFSGNQTVLLNGTSNTTADIKAASLQTFSAAAWNALNTGEAAPSVPATYALYLPTYGTELIPSGSFANGLTGWKSWFLSTLTGNVATTALNGCSGTCALFHAGSVFDVLSSPAFNMSTGGLYQLSFSATFASSGAVSIPGISRNVAPSDSFISAPGISSLTSLSGTAGQTINYVGTFTASNGAAANLNLSAAAGTTVGFGSVSLKPITGFTLSNVSDWAATVAAPLGTATTVDCPTLGWSAGCKVTDVNGNAVALPTTVAAGTAQLFLRVDTTWKQ